MSDETKARKIADQIAQSLHRPWRLEAERAIAAALSAATEAGWRAGVEAAAQAADEIRRLYRGYSAADKVADAIRALPYPAPEPQVEPAATSGGGQPADAAVIERARELDVLQQRRDAGQMRSNDHVRYADLIAGCVVYARALLARADAAEARVAEQAAEIERLVDTLTKARTEVMLARRALEMMNASCRNTDRTFTILDDALVERQKRAALEEAGR